MCEKFCAFYSLYPNCFNTGNVNLSRSTKDKYYYALATLKVEPVRDWYVTKLLNRAFTYDKNYEDVLYVYNDFKDMCTNEDYMDIINTRYETADALRPGKMAPDFELVDENGNSVRLSDLKGKIVYIDFWAVWCGPCIAEFKSSKDKLHEKYKDYDITYVYICVDGSDEQWKSMIQKYNLDGVNLMAKGWQDNPVCKDYNVQGVPHYVLIDKEGKIVDSKCDRPSTILASNMSTFAKFIEAQK